MPADAYPEHSVVYEWLGGPAGVSVDFEPGLALSQFDLMAAPHRNFTISRRDGRVTSRKPRKATS